MKYDRVVFMKDEKVIATVPSGCYVALILGLAMGAYLFGVLWTVIWKVLV